MRSTEAGGRAGRTEDDGDDRADNERTEDDDGNGGRTEDNDDDYGTDDGRTDRG